MKNKFKPFSLALLTLALIAQPSLAREAAPKQEYTMQANRLNYLITEDLDRFHSLIHSEAEALPLESRYQLYLQTRIHDTYPASFLNALPGAGVGSFTMGDANGGWLLLGGEIAGACLAVLGTVISGGSASTTGFFTSLGTAVVLGFRLYGIFRPLQYAGNYNAQLKDTLELRQTNLSQGPLTTEWKWGVRF